MKYALVLESTAETCSSTANLVASMGYLVTPVFNPKKALHAAHMIQFDLIVTCKASIPGDRRSLTGEFARCSPDALLILVTEPEPSALDRQFSGVDAVINRHVLTQDLRKTLDCGKEKLMRSIPQRLSPERRKRAVD